MTPTRRCRFGVAVLTAICLLAALGAAPQPAAAQSPPQPPALPKAPPFIPPPVDPSAPPPKPEVEDLGNGQYRIGAIAVDKAKQRFSVPGAVIDLGDPNMPLEFLVIAKNGHKAYESAVMVETDAFAFNVACILIGLSNAAATQPSRHFDPEPVQGDPVAVSISWQRDGRTIEKGVAALVRIEGGSKAADDWVYTGSIFLGDGSYAAHVAGTLVGFVHDPESIIQHRTGIGLGQYGAATYAADVGPPPGTPVTITVRRR